MQESIKHRKGTNGTNRKAARIAGSLRGKENGKSKGTNDDRREGKPASNSQQFRDFLNRLLGEDCTWGNRELGGKIIEQLLRDYSQQLHELEEHSRLLESRRQRLKQRIKELEELRNIDTD